MDRLSPDLLEYIFTLLDPREIATCARVCKRHNGLIRKSVVIQLLLRQYLHKSSLHEGEKCYPAAERLRRLIVREQNLDQMKPRISSFHMPQDQIIHTVSGRYVVTQPAQEADKAEEDGRYTLCTVWRWGKAQKVKVDFKPFTDMIDLDIHQDIIVVQQDESNTGKAHGVLLRFFRLFNNTEDAEEYCEGVRILEDEWTGPEPHEISLTLGGRVMVWCEGVIWIWDWAKQEPLGRLPPHAFKKWASNLGMAWAGKGIVLGLDMPHDVHEAETQKAALAVFEVDTSYPGTSTLPLRLELPFGTDLLEDTAREVLHLPPSDTIDLVEGEIPYLARNGPLGLIVVGTNFLINNSIEMRLLVVLPTMNLTQFRLQKERSQPDLEFAWGDEWDPFHNVEIVHFDIWRKHAFIWAEPDSTPAVYPGMYEIQNSLRLVSFDCSALKEWGKLHLTTVNFNERRYMEIISDTGTLGGLGEVNLVEADGYAHERRRPIDYRRSIIPATPHNMGCVRTSADFILGRKGAANTAFFCGERLLIQMRGEERVWALDFGVHEIAGREGEEAKAELETGLLEGDDRKKAEEKASNVGQEDAWALSQGCGRVEEWEEPNHD